MSAFRPWHRITLALAFAGVGIGTLAWIARHDAAINFLPEDRRAEWIVFPAAVDAHAHWFADLDATFRREFVLAEQPRTARLMIRAMRRAEVKINGVSSGFRAERNWKQITDIDITGHLHAGTNVIDARVFNHNGPPALWVLLVTDQVTLRSDDQAWEASFAGSSWRHAALASTAKTPGPGNALAGAEHTFDAVKKSWLFWMVLGAIAGIIVFVWHSRMQKSGSRDFILLLALAGLWLVLFWNNNRFLPFHRGFDAKEHLNYINYIQQHRSLPLPTEGWEMYQPPLYYLIAAATLSVGHLLVDDQLSITLLRGLGALFGVAQLVLVFYSLRLLLPIRAVLIGVLLAAFLPMHLYMAHYVTNEVLAATLTTAALYFCLSLCKTDRPSAAQCAWVGLALGAAMLAKATAILLFPVIIAAVATKLAYTRVPMAISLRNLGVLVAICVALCGWHYGRIWLKFGTPLIGNWDVVSGFTWWQDPGYHTMGDYLRFGRSLINPLFSGFAGIADGIYSTLWGDGLCGGVSSPDLPWNQQPMLAGYLWGLIPTTLIFMGAVIAVVRFVRKPSSALFLLLGFCAVISLGFVFMTLKVPSYAQAKAFYGLSALMPLCFFCALGWETLTRGRAYLQLIACVLLLFWALNSFASYWIVPSTAQHVYAAEAFGTQGKTDRASEEALKAVEADPSNATARGVYALALNEVGNDEEAIKEAEREIELNPTDSTAHLDLAIAAKRSDLERAISEARRATDLGPENSSAYQFLSNCLFEARRYNEARDRGREWLAVSPYDAGAHSAVAFASAEKGDLVSAAQQLGYVIMLRPGAEQSHAQLHQILQSLAKDPNGSERLGEIAANAPDSPRMLDELAWLLATYPDSNTRDGAEAVRLAERACAITERRVPALLDTLAAAYAEVGDFPRGISVAEQALNLARSSGDSEAIKLSENILGSLRENRPCREQPE